MRADRRANLLSPTQVGAGVGECLAGAIAADSTAPHVHQDLRGERAQLVERLVERGAR